MGDGLHFWKKAGQNGYRLLYTGMLLGIVLAGAGRFLGIGTLSYLHVLTAVSVLLFCAGLQRCTAKGRAVCVLLTAVFLGAVAAALRLIGLVSVADGTGRMGRAVADGI